MVIEARLQLGGPHPEPRLVKQSQHHAIEHQFRADYQREEQGEVHPVHGQVHLLIRPYRSGRARQGKGIKVPFAAFVPASAAERIESGTFLRAACWHDSEFRSPFAAPI